MKDSGIGIAQENMPKIFEEFEQLENHMVKFHQGTGLGLPISKSLIESMGGRIWVESALGKGSRFCFTLPGVLVTGTPVKPAEKEISPAPMDTRGLGPVLVVEDMEINGELTQQLLLEMGIASDLATDRCV